MRKKIIRNQIMYYKIVFKKNKFLCSVDVNKRQEGFILKYINIHKIIINQIITKCQYSVTRKYSKRSKNRDVKSVEM